MTNEWSKNLLITFDETDLGGVVYFANTLKLAHRFIESFVVDQIIDWKMWFQHPEWIVPIKHITCDYKTPLFAGKDCTGKITLKKLGHSSVTFETRLLQDNKTCAVVQSTHVFVQTKSHSIIRMPQAIRDSLSQWV